MKLSSVLFVITFFYRHVPSRAKHSCDSLIYCQGKLLDTVQKSKIFSDSKKFVDMVQVNPSSVTLDNFDNFMKKTDDNPTKSDVKQFVKSNFLTEGDVEEWTPTDFKINPEFLVNINDEIVRELAKTLVSIWPQLGRKVKEEVRLNPDRYSIITVPNGFIVPGGRFREMYYWDSYWIIKGLLLCEMYDTVRGTLENFLFLVRKFGFVPNGTRIYYLNRSQPPLLALMVGLYIDATGDVEWLRKNIGAIEVELNWWLTKKTVILEKDGMKHTVARFSSNSGTPRPESYYEDVKTCAIFKDSLSKERCYNSLKSGAESGWDFSSRWMYDSKGGINSNLTYIQTNFIAPVDLNSFLCKGLKEISRFYKLVGDDEKSSEWQEKFRSWRRSVELMFYDKVDGIWYDYDIMSSKPRKQFYLSNFAPLWSECYDVSLSEEYGSRAAKYFTAHGINHYEGGIPTSVIHSDEQWDWPNVWPPLQEIVILGFKKTGNAEARAIAETFTRRWIAAIILGRVKHEEIYEKYDAVVPGRYGGGGEYAVQVGFGWTNGVTLSLIKEFYVNNSMVIKFRK